MVSDFEVTWLEFCRDFADSSFISIDDQHRIEIEMLCAAGCQHSDYAFAFRAWARAKRVHDDWGYIRTTMFTHRAEKKLMIREVAG